MITVLIPTYKRTDDVNRCLHSVLKQSRQPDEVLVIVRDSDEGTRSMLEREFSREPCVKVTTITIPGVVAALNAGLERATGSIIAILDDDTAPRPDWLSRIESHFAGDPRLGGLGGRDWVHQHGRMENGSRHVVGRVQWFGRVVGNHHLGVGSVREVDVLKGCNMSYRREAVDGIRFDVHLKGSGAQVYNDMDFSMCVKKAGWKLVYDPEVAVDHYPAPRYDEDQRNRFNTLAHFNMVHNETIVLLRYLGVWKRIPYLIWAVTVGMTSSPGLIQWIRLMMKRKETANQKLIATMRGRWEGLRTWRSHNKGGAS
jgi:cellulose synthase/poly-beta-1,6-N-acetylglucosamine synthase-like glycosyltransferase